MCIGKHICRHKKTNSKKDIRALPKVKKYLKVYDDTWHNFIYGFMLCQFTVNLCHQVYIFEKYKIYFDCHFYTFMSYIEDYSQLAIFEILRFILHRNILWGEAPLGIMGFCKNQLLETEIRKVFFIIELRRTLNESMPTHWEPFWLILHNFMAISRIIIAQLC